MVTTLRWTAEEDRQLRELAATGTEAVRIARRLGRTESAVRTRCNRLEIQLAKAGNQGLGLKAKGK
jgi:hypothetical protein